MLKIGLTGGIGSGKSTVAGIFEVLGIPVFNADEQARALMEQDDEVRTALEARFGSAIYPEGKLDRKALATIIFNDPPALAAGNSIVHPAVRKAFTIWAAEQTAAYVIMEAALMAENDGYKAFDRVITVSCPEPERIRRVMKRDGVEEEAVVARIRNQASEEERSRIAQHVIHNAGEELVIPQVLAIHTELLALSKA